MPDTVHRPSGVLQDAVNSDGIQVGELVYDEMSKNMLMIVCDDDDKNEIIDIIMDTAQTGESGNSGDGRIFVLPVEESYTISSQSKDD